ncbi:MULTISPECIES: ribonuclease HII [Bacillaceae]|uniref:ribonuclease HII n=1 Tax=Bacillaceae TaxID=186817 RepID=UPI001C56F072|nr:ribonuclease HII [Rossellomorea sp. YZS02]MBW3113889.1 ribonuclease HII [Bacillus sp. MCCB 382]MDX8343079.1 ribonuclease HII [Rossellomorea sp. YZS02]
MTKVHRTIKEVKELIGTLSDSDPILEELKQDDRKGVQKLLMQLDRERMKQEKEKEEFDILTRYETELRQQGFTHIAGIDEVGRGPLAGPVVTAAVILPSNFYLAGLNDSKKLSEAKREEYYEYIQKHAISIGIGMVHAEEIDSINIYQATKKAMNEAIVELPVEPDYLLIDAMKIQSPYPSQSIIKGDAKSISIAAASIIAKVTRDRMMKEYALKYPGYAFEKNAGYGTKDHLIGLEQLGVTPLHRKSFAPVKEILHSGH